MLRYRRYRVFLAVAVIFILVVVRLRHTEDWAQYPLTGALENSSEKEDSQIEFVAPARKTTPTPTPPTGHYKPEDTLPPKAKETPPPRAHLEKPSPTPTPKNVGPVYASVPNAKATPESVPQVVLPDRKQLPPTKVLTGEEKVDLHQVAPPGRQEYPTWSAVPTTIHWEKQLEHFPIPTESIIKLPTGAPVKIPKIQHDFNDETPDAKINREKRQSQVKAEFKKAWGGYKKNAWLHDELSPVSGSFRDPFCGWAATLVDALDTLWIMGLEEEFEEAVNAIDLIDFTTSPRGDIPMFETTIRYLGGLLAAYDVSGGKYKNLLDKATELGEILIGAFDTPNRMPVLYYMWKPTFASQPHRASTRSNTAELGSLSLEFTRLTQLTHDPRYYDAVARITNELSDWQDRGTMLPGVFPDNIDASGCNRTATTQLPKSAEKDPSTSPAKSAEEPIGFQPLEPEVVKEPKPKKKKIKDDTPDLEMQVLPGEPGTAQILGWEDESTGGKQKKIGKRGMEDASIGERDVDPVEKRKADRSLVEERGASETPAAHLSTSLLPTDNVTGLPIDIPKAKEMVGESVGDWDCVHQGLEPSSPGRGKFSMAGGQDSTYEYFPKQYLLLGGLDETYKKMYLATIDAVRQWMLFRPMIPDERDILFSGTVTTAGEPEIDHKLIGDVDHLTCFIGGMVGMGAKIFGIEGDLEIAKKLADGCVWAYQSTTTGIMPEGAVLMPCESSVSCSWNETAYWEFLDPSAHQRDKNVEKYLINKAAREEEEEVAAEAAALKAKEEAANPSTISSQNATVSSTGLEGVSEDMMNDLLDTPGSDSLKKEEAVALAKRGEESFADEIRAKKREATVQPRTGTFNDDVDIPPLAPDLQAQKLYEQKSLHTEAELAAVAGGGRQGGIPVHPHEVPPLGSPSSEPFYDPAQPLSHQEYVEQRIQREGLPPGYTSIKARKYILRPEAIESVWYMYRITGDSSWQDKGWTMFEAIINATSTEYGHSAIYDVLDKGAPLQGDEMESFWLAETLKYFYLLYSTPDVISLDEWVLNTEAHPFKRPS